MGNILKSDFYRLFKSLSFYICLLVLVVLTSGQAYINNWAYQMMQESGSQASSAISIFKDGLSYGLETFSAGNTIIFMAIFIAMFVSAEFTHGTMKNIVSKGFSKLQIYFSKLITMIAATFLMLLAGFVFGTLAATIISGKFGTLNATYVGNMFRMIGIELLLYAALTAVFVLISMVVRSTGGVIAINIIGVASFGPMIYQLLEFLFKNKIKFSQYGLQNNIAMFRLIAPPMEDIIRAIIVGAAFFVVTTVLGIFAFKKADVK